MSETLVAYFSTTGVTEKVAKEIAQISGADLFAIKPEIPYTSADLNWMDKNSRSTIEMQDHSSRPAIAETVSNIEKYDTIFLGFPIWWYVAPTIINTFLESYNWSGKTIRPFFTSGGSGAGQTDERLHSSAPHAGWRPAKRINPGDMVNIKDWIEDKGV